MDDFQLRVQADRKAMALEAITDNDGQLHPDFPAWLEANWHIWTRFEELALQTASKREHYSVATLWEVIRHHTTMAEADSQFKLNNNFKPDCARLFALLHPELANFFETRRRTASLLEAV